MEPLGDLKVKTEIDLSVSSIKEEPNMDNNVDENVEALTDLQQHASEWKMDCSLGPGQSSGNHSRYDPKQDRCSPIRDVPPEFEKVFVKVEDVSASDEEPVEQKFWIEESSVGQDPQPGCCSWSDEVDYQHGRDLDSTTVNSKGGFHQHKELIESRSAAFSSPVTDYPVHNICCGSENDCRNSISCSNTITLNNTSTVYEAHACGFEQKEYLSIPLEVLDKETKTSTMELVDKEMLVVTHFEQNITQNSSRNRLKMENYVCKICDFETPNLKFFKDHMMKEHSDGTPFHCKFCDYKCSQSSQLKVHERKHTGKHPLHCQFCEYKCSRSSHLKVHERSHTGEKPYNCKFCDYKCSSSSHLKVHERTHTGEKPFNCKFCDFKYSNSSDLKVHERTHTGEKPFTCVFCDYKCSRSSQLKVHERSHTGEKPYNCKFCDYKCSNSSHLKVHERSHTGEKPFICEFCGYKCTTRFSLKVHQKTHW